MATTAGARPKPGARKTIWFFHMGGRGPNIWAIFLCLAVHSDSTSESKVEHPEVEAVFLRDAGITSGS